MMNVSSTEQALQVRAYLSRKRRENGNERLRLAKALQWYFFYGALITVALFLIHNYPGVLNIFSSVSSYVVVIVFYILMYGLVFIAYMSTPWPYPLLFEKSAAVRSMDWSPQLCWVERIMTVIYYTFFFVGVLPDYIKKDYVGAGILGAAQLPHVLTCIMGFPARLAPQLLGLFLRITALFFSFAQLHLSFITFDKYQTLLISGVLGALPFALVVGMYFNGRLPKSKTTFFWGETNRRDLVIIGISASGFIIWEGLLCMMLFYYNTPAFPAQYFWLPLEHPFATLTDFLQACIVTCMAILSIPLVYHSMLNIRVTYPGQPFQLESVESTRLIDAVEMQVPNSAPNNFMDDIALVIACHKSKDNIIKTLNAAHHYANFPLKNIYIAHNAGKDEPIDETGAVVWASEEYRDVHYIYIPVGNKSIAMDYIVEKYILPTGITQVIMIDDDVLFPTDIDLRGGYEQIANDSKVKAVAFTIRGLEESTFWQKFQHMEYMQAGLLKLFQGQFGSVLTCHGAISLWDVQACCDVFALHNTEFHGEDLQMGLILRKMNQEYRIEANAVGPVATASPKSLLYETDANEKSLFSQRVFSWDMAAHHFFLDFMRLTLFNWESCGLILKPFMIVELWTMLQDWLRFLFIANVFQEDPLTAMLLVGLLILLQTIVVIIFDRIILSHRPELQSPTYICLIYPFYNIITVMFRFVGLLYNTLVYTPWNPPRILIKDRKKMGLVPPRVAEPWGTPEERRHYWFNVWKPVKKQQPLELDETVIASIASVAQIMVDAANPPEGQEQGNTTPRSIAPLPSASVTTEGKATPVPRIIAPPPAASVVVDMKPSMSESDTEHDFTHDGSPQLASCLKREGSIISTLKRNNSTVLKRDNSTVLKRENSSVTFASLDDFDPRCADSPRTKFEPPAYRKTESEPHLLKKRVTWGKDLHAKVELTANRTPNVVS